MTFPPAVLDAQAIYEKAWRDFLRRGFFVENMVDKPDLPHGVTVASTRLVVRRAAGQRRILFVQAFAPLDGKPFKSIAGDGHMGHWLIDVPRQKRAQALIAMLNLVVPSDAPGWAGRQSRDAGAPRKVWRTSMNWEHPRCAAVWNAITRALATNNDIRAQMGLPLFTGGVTVGVTEQEAA